MVVVVKKVKKVNNFDRTEKNRPQIFLFGERGYIDQKLTEESNKNGSDALKIPFLV